LNLKQKKSMLKVDLHIGNRLLMLIDRREFSISIPLGIIDLKQKGEG